jgi:hypothetical protein
LAIGYPKGWDDEIENTVCGTSNLRYIRSDEGWRFASIPDGYEFTIVQPVHPTALRDAARVLRELEDRGGLGANVVAYAHLDESHVSYRLGKSRTVSDALDLMKLTADLTGLPPATPVLEKGEDGSEALTIKRRHYFLVVECFLRDLCRVVETLKEQRIVGRGAGTAGARVGCDLPEQAGLLVRDGLEQLGATVQWFDELGDLQLLFNLNFDTQLYASAMVPTLKKWEAIRASCRMGPSLTTWPKLPGNSPMT